MLICHCYMYINMCIAVLDFIEISGNKQHATAVIYFANSFIAFTQARKQDFQVYKCLLSTFPRKHA